MNTGAFGSRELKNPSKPTDYQAMITLLAPKNSAIEREISKNIDQQCEGQCLLALKNRLDICGRNFLDDLYRIKLPESEAQNIVGGCSKTSKQKSLLVNNDFINKWMSNTAKNNGRCNFDNRDDENFNCGRPNHSGTNPMGNDRVRKVNNNYFMRKMNSIKNYFTQGYPICPEERINKCQDRQQVSNDDALCPDENSRTPNSNRKTDVDLYALYSCNKDFGITVNGLSRNLINSLRTLKLDTNLNVVRTVLNANADNPNRETYSSKTGLDLMNSSKSILELSTEEAEATILYHIIKGAVNYSSYNSTNLNVKTYSTIMNFPKYTNLGLNKPQQLSIETINSNDKFHYTVFDGSHENINDQMNIVRPRFGRNDVYGVIQIINSIVSFWGKTDSYTNLDVVLVDKVLTLPKNLDYVIERTSNISKFSTITRCIASGEYNGYSWDKIKSLSNLVGFIPSNKGIDNLILYRSELSASNFAPVKFNTRVKKRYTDDSLLSSERLYNNKLRDNTGENKYTTILSDKNEKVSVTKGTDYDLREGNESDASDINNVNEVFHNESLSQEDGYETDEVYDDHSKKNYSEDLKDKVWAPSSTGERFGFKEGNIKNSYR
ncbi:hypothetical protein AYI70_g9863, partial [Smittium culicis]